MPQLFKPPGQPDYGLVQVVENIPAPDTGREEVARWVRDLLARSADMQRRQALQPKEIPRTPVKKRARRIPGRAGISKRVFSFQTGNRLRLFLYSEREVSRG